MHYLGTFLADPTDVPTEVVDYLSAQLGIVDPSCLKAYREREMTRLEHAREIRDVYEFTWYSLTGIRDSPTKPAKRPGRVASPLSV